MFEQSAMTRDADNIVTILRGWANAYRNSPEHRFPSDPNAEFLALLRKLENYS